MSIRFDRLLPAALLTATAVALAACGVRSSDVSDAATPTTVGLRAAAPGQLPAGDSTTIGGVYLGSGHPVRSADAPNAPPRAWLSASPATPDDWLTVAAQFPTTGLWPVVVDGLNGRGADAGLDRPWFDGEFDEVGTADGIDAADVMRDGWTRLAQERDEYGEDSLGPWPGLAAGSPGPAEFRAPAEFGRYESSAGLLLVPVTRPADVVGALGWLGATNYWTAGQVSAVLRSWEDRFGAVPIFMNFDMVYLYVQRPPAEADDVGQVTAEHAAFIPDMIWQESESYEAYRDTVVGHSWYLWWD